MRLRPRAGRRARAKASFVSRSAVDIRASHSIGAPIKSCDVCISGIYHPQVIN